MWWGCFGTREEKVPVKGFQGTRIRVRDNGIRRQSWVDKVSYTEEAIRHREKPRVVIGGFSAMKKRKDALAAKAKETGTEKSS
jgi:hypothetical protein